MTGRVLEIDPNTRLVEVDPGDRNATADDFKGREWPERKPLQRELPPANPFPLGALGGILAPAAQKMQTIIRAPAAICGNSVLAAAALAVQAHADVVIDGRVFPASEIFLTIGESGERKSEVDKAAQCPHRKHERSLCEQYKQDVIGYQRDREAYDKTKSEVLSSKQNKSLDAKRRALAELGDVPLPPLEPLLLCEEPTYEGLVKLLAAGQPSVGLFSDEGGRFIGGHGMNPDNLLKTAAGMSGLWDGKPVDRVRGGDGATKLYGRRVSCHLMVQPEISQLMLSNSILIAQGLLSRCLVTWPESTAGTRFYCEEDLSVSPEITKYTARISAILETPLPLAEGARNELNPRQLPLAPDAKRIWINFHDHVERQLADGGELAPIRGLGNKAPEHAARLASVLALGDDLHCPCIRLEHIKAGIELVTHYLNEALRLYEAGIQDPTLALTQKLLVWLKAKGKAIITLPEVYQHGPNPIRTAAKARELMAILVDHGEAIPVGDGVEYRGKRYFEAWRVRL